MGTEDVLDNPVYTALTGPHAHFAERYGRALRYPLDVSPFIAVDDPTDPGAWADVAGLVGPGQVVPVTGVSQAPPGWEVLGAIAGVQLVDDGVAAAPDAEAVVLGPDDVPEMLALVQRTRPGPFLSRTVELGRYLGLRHQGALIAMAGERLHPPGWTEISAVCTDPTHRGRGLASRLVRAVAEGIRQRGDTPFLHASESNTNAIRLYRSLGFRLRRTTTFMSTRTPAGAAVG